MTLTLDRAPLKTPLVFLGSTAAPEVTRRLAEMGLRRGAQLECVQRTSGRGRVVAVAGSRIALDARLLSCITALAVEDVDGLRDAHRVHLSATGVPEDEAVVSHGQADRS